MSKRTARPPRLRSAPGRAWSKRPPAQYDTHHAAGSLAEWWAEQLERCRHAWEEGRVPWAILEALRLCRPAGNYPGAPPPEWVCHAVAAWIFAPLAQPKRPCKVWRQHFRDMRALVRAAAFEDGRELGMTRARAAAFAARQMRTITSPAAVLKSVARVALLPPSRRADVGGAWRHASDREQNQHAASALLMGDFRPEHLRFLAVHYLWDRLGPSPLPEEQLVADFGRYTRAAVKQPTMAEARTALVAARRVLHVQVLPGPRWEIPGNITTLPPGWGDAYPRVFREESPPD